MRPFPGAHEWRRPNSVSLRDHVRSRTEAAATESAGTLSLPRALSRTKT